MTTLTAPRLNALPPIEAQARVLSGDAVLIDVREAFEFNAERIDSAEHHPLSSLDPDAINTLAGDRLPIFYCRTGLRSTDAATRFASVAGDATHIQGGLVAWKDAALPVYRSAHAPRIDVMRQVQIAAGSLVLVGVLLGILVHPGFLGISAFVGGGLVFAGLSGWCGMAKLLLRMPWNTIPG